jgi:hypothetical protein
MQIKIMRKDRENKSTGNKPFEAPVSSSPKNKKSNNKSTGTIHLDAFELDLRIPTYLRAK